MNKWLETSDSRYSTYLFNNSSKIPSILKQANTLYRGVYVTPDFANSKTNRLNKSTSWSKNKNMAMNFINNKKYSIRDSSNRIPILITKKISTNDIILDIDAYVNFYGEDNLIYMGFDDLAIDSALKESEVLVKPITISKSDYVFL